MSVYSGFRRLGTSQLFSPYKYFNCIWFDILVPSNYTALFNIFGGKKSFILAVATKSLSLVLSQDSVGIKNRIENSGDL